MAPLNGTFGSDDPSTPAVLGESTKAEGVRGVSHKLHAGVVGINDAGHDGTNIPQLGQPGPGVLGKSIHGTGVAAESVTAEAVHAETTSGSAAVAAYNTGDGDGFAIYGNKKGPKGFAGFFEGNVWVKGDVGLSGVLTADQDVQIKGADCAEDFDVIDTQIAEPGTVMVLNDDAVLVPSHSVYDKRVVGVVSGAGLHRPGIVLDKQQSRLNRSAIALLGKTYCKVDAQYGSIGVGDLLTTSSTPGHAMKAADPFQAFGAAIGKALRPLHSGQGLIPILITLQ